MESQIRKLTQSLIRLQNHLAAQGIQSALIGGLSLSVWAQARVTKDIDVKVLLSRADAEKLLTILGSDYKPLHQDPLRALQRNGIVFVQDTTGIRIDLMLSDTHFDRTVVERAQRLEVRPELWAMVATAEDLIIYKMISPRLQDNVDVEQIVRVQGNKLDDAYVLKWLKQFEAMLDDSTLVVTYQRHRKKHP